MQNPQESSFNTLKFNHHFLLLPPPFSFHIFGSALKPNVHFRLILGLSCCWNRCISQGSCCIIGFKIESQRISAINQSPATKKGPLRFQRHRKKSFLQSKTQSPGAALTCLNSPWLQRSSKCAGMGKGKRKPRVEEQMEHRVGTG